ncbi:18998_t:CDS:2 [Funneliformis geosporum]|uniref:18998_t:CDS:1 n=1 Tax=Funneliformis geosporum TaxID=1117311 RepID=A0A9W4WIP0_9GLOM|nr:18998_t:CDS:2 [Funneliformis geosporum]
MENAQEWLDKNYPKEIRNEIKNLYLKEKKIEGDLNLSDFVNLNELDCSDNFLTSLNINNCKHLKRLDVSFNHLTNLEFSGSYKLEVIKCNDNFLTNFDYSLLSANKLTYLNISDNNLPYQDLSPFSQSLKCLDRLENLNISNTDINIGIEYLPNSINKISYLTQEKSKEIKLWIDSGLTVKDHTLAEYLKNDKKIEPLEAKSRLDELTKEYNLA